MLCATGGGGRERVQMCAGALMQVLRDGEGRKPKHNSDDDDNNKLQPS